MDFDVHFNKLACILTLLEFKKLLKETHVFGWLLNKSKISCYTGHTVYTVHVCVVNKIKMKSALVAQDMGPYTHTWNAKLIKLTGS